MRFNIQKEMAYATDEYTFSSNFNPNTLNDDFFRHILKKIDHNAQLLTWTTENIDSSDSILTTLAQHTKPSNHQKSSSDALEDAFEDRKENYEAHCKDLNDKSYIGFYRFKISYSVTGCAETFSKGVVIKSKTSGDTILRVYETFLTQGGEEFAKTLSPFLHGDMEHREIEFYRMQLKEIQSISPDIYLTVDDMKHNIHLIVMEDMDNPGFKLKKTIDCVELWSEHDIETVLKDLAHFHAYFLGRTDEIPHNFRKYLKYRISTEIMQKKLPGLKLLLEHNTVKVPEMCDPETSILVNKAIDNIKVIYSVLGNCPFTLTHGDAQPRNLCLRTNPPHGKRSLCLFDWESCYIDIPHRDIIDLLANILPDNSPPSLWNRYRDIYRESLAEELQSFDNISDEIQNSVKPEEFNYIFKVCVVDIIMDRYAFYTFGHLYNPHKFFIRVTTNIKSYMKSFAESLDIFFP